MQNDTQIIWQQMISVKKTCQSVCSGCNVWVRFFRRSHRIVIGECRHSLNSTYRDDIIVIRLFSLLCNNV